MKRGESKVRRAGRGLWDRTKWDRRLDRIGGAQGKLLESGAKV